MRPHVVVDLQVRVTVEAGKPRAGLRLEGTVADVARELLRIIDPSLARIDAQLPKVAVGQACSVSIAVELAPRPGEPL